ncbi:uncharacterized protein LOC134212465 isoform X2 [Armigeres subalbatus]
MTAGLYRTQNERQYRPQKPKRTIQNVNIADQVQVLADKKKKTSEKESAGVALFNKFKVSDFERWAQQFQEQRTQKITEQLSKNDQNGDDTAFQGAAGGKITDIADNSRTMKENVSNRRLRSSTIDWSQESN